MGKRENICGFRMMNLSIVSSDDELYAKLLSSGKLGICVDQSMDVKAT